MNDSTLAEFLNRQAQTRTRLRADHNLRTPDAVQAATALASQATGFITNDPAYKRVAGVEILILDELADHGESPRSSI